MKTKRLDNIDILKCVAIMMVISLHANIWHIDFINVSSAWRVMEYGFRLLSEGVPLFAAINGFLMFRKDSFSLNKHLKKTAHLLLLIVEWSLILNTLSFAFVERPKPFTLNNISGFLLQPSFGLWFLQALFGVYLVFPALWNLYKHSFNVFRYIFILETILIAGSSVLNLFRDAVSESSHIDIIDNIIVFCGWFNAFGANWFLYYFCLGGMIYHYWDFVRKNRLLLSGLGVASWAAAFIFGYTQSIKEAAIYNDSFNYGSVFMIVIIISFFAATSRFTDCRHPLSICLCSIGKNTFGIYLSHMLLLRIIAKHYDYASSPYRFAVFFLVLLLGYTFSILMNNSTHLKKLLTI